MSKYIWNLDGDPNDSAVRARRRARAMQLEEKSRPPARGHLRLTALILGGVVFAIAVTLVSVEIGVRAGAGGVAAARFEGARRYFGLDNWRRAHSPKKQNRPAPIAPADGGVG